MPLGELASPAGSSFSLRYNAEVGQRRRGASGSGGVELADEAQVFRTFHCVDEPRLHHCAHQWLNASGIRGSAIRSSGVQVLLRTE